MPDVVNRRSGKVIYTEKQIQTVTELYGKVSSEMNKFLTDAAKPTNQSSARRARTCSLTLEKLLKEYRRISIK